MSIPLQLGHTVTLTPDLQPNKEATVESTTLSISAYDTVTQDNTAINFMNNLGDILVHVSIRRLEDTVVLNSRTASGPWGNEERFPGLKRAFGPNLDSAKIVVRDIGTQYQVYTNGNYLGTYDKRIGGEAITASYAINSGQDSALSNPVQVGVN